MTNNMNYEESLQLLERLSRNKNYVDLLRKKGETEKTWAAVKYDLSKYQYVKIEEIEKKQISVSIEEQVEQVKKKISNHAEKTAALPKNILSIAINQPDSERLNKIIERKNRTFKEASALFHTLEFLPIEDRKNAAERILKGFDLIEKEWEIIDYYNENKRFPDFKANQTQEIAKEAEKETDRAVLAKRQATLRTYISKYEKALKTVRTEKERQKINSKLDEFKLELNQINEELAKN